MKITVSTDICVEVASQIFKLINNTSTIALPTGNTPVDMYTELVKLSGTDLNWLKTNIFILDVYYPQDPNDPNSFYSYIKNNLLDNINLPPENFHILDSNTKNTVEECLKYEENINKAGGIDLAILGIGENGHIAFNEPGTLPNSETHLTNLTPETLAANGNIPGINQGLTMGIKTIMSAKKIFLLAKGKAKAKAVRDAVEGPISTSCPASYLQNHADCTFYLDEDAASLLATLQSHS